MADWSASQGATIGCVSMVLATAINSSAVKASAVMMRVSSKILAKMIMINDNLLIPFVVSLSNHERN